MGEGVVGYRFLSVIGEGGFGRVYRARLETQDGFNKEVAIKLLSDPDPPKSLLTRFRDEAKILGLLRDRAIVGVEPPIQIAGRWAVVMEFVDGASCGALIAKGPMPPGVAVEIVMEIARALHNAYHQDGPEGEPLNLLHRDIKPDNIQITPAGEVKILDFGIARANFAAREFKTKHSFGGTPGYIAPERPRGIELPVGDIYSLGVVLHEVVTGTRPRYTPTIHLDVDIAELATELDVPPAMLEDPDTAEALRLAGWMRAEDPENRPNARQVEDACRKLRLKLPPPFLREWAEEHVPHRVELAPDDMIGKVLTTTFSTTIPMAVPDARTATLPLISRDSPTVVQTQPGNRLALGALLGTSAAMLVLIGVIAATFGGIGLYMLVRSNLASTTDTDLPVTVLPQTDGPEPDGPEPDGPEPDTTDAPATDAPVEPAPVRPQVPQPPPVPVVVVPDPVPVVVVPVQPDPQPVQPVQPDPQPVGPKILTGRLIVRTIPSGGSVQENGATLQKVGRDYELRTGYHSLRLVSPSGGESTPPIPIQISRDETVEICWNFDMNKSCSTSGP